MWILSPINVIIVTKISHYACGKILKAEKKKKGNNNRKNELVVVAMVAEAFVVKDQVEW